MKSITVSELSALQHATVIDVREPDEYATGHLPDAVNIPFEQLAERQADIPTGDVVYVVCQSGGRSARATDYLVGTGVAAVNVDGGTTAWMDAGYETTIK